MIGEQAGMYRKAHHCHAEAADTGLIAESQQHKQVREALTWPALGTFTEYSF